MTNTKVHINTKALTIEIEGEDDFVRTYLDRLLPIIDRIGSSDEKSEKHSAHKDNGVAKGSLLSEVDGPKSSKQQRLPRGAGPSCRQRIKALRAGGFFKEPHGIAEIVEKLKLDGHDYSLNQVGAALSTMSGKNEIQRENVGGRYRYFDEDRQGASIDGAEASG